MVKEEPVLDSDEEEVMPKLKSRSRLETKDVKNETKNEKPSPKPHRMVKEEEKGYSPKGGKDVPIISKDRSERASRRMKLDKVDEKEQL